MSHRPDLSIAIGWIAVVTTLILVPVGVWNTVTGTGDPSSSLIDGVLFRLPGLTLGPVGLLIATRRRENRIGWILIALGLDIAASAVASDASRLVADPFAASLLGMVGDVGWLALITLFCALVLLYPDGQLPSRRWRPLGFAVPGWLALFVISVALAPISLHNGVPVPNPIGGAPGVLGVAAQLSLGLAIVLLVPLLLAVVTAAIARWRRSTGVERQQLRLFVYMATLVVLGLTLSATALPGPWVATVALATIGLPIAIAIAIFRYRLYDIDVVVERTLVYGALSASLAATYWILVIFLQSALRPLTGGSELAVAGSTLMTLALVQPLRTRIQRAVDRRFYRGRYDAVLAVDAFSVRLRDEVALEAVRGDLLDAVGQTVQPTTASLWLRDRNDSRTLAG